jgi:hypothetical protein
MSPSGRGLPVNSKSRDRLLTFGADDQRQDNKNQLLERLPAEAVRRLICGKLSTDDPNGSFAIGRDRLFSPSFSVNWPQILFLMREPPVHR